MTLVPWLRGTFTGEGRPEWLPAGWELTMMVPTGTSSVPAIFAVFVFQNEAEHFTFTWMVDLSFEQTSIDKALERMKTRFLTAIETLPRR